MGRIASTFKRLRKLNEAALIPYVTVGYPSLEVMRQLVPVIARQGADLIELGLSLSDPAGEPRPQLTFGAALGRGVSLADCLSVAAEARRANEIPLLFTSYYNPIREYGPQQFADDCAASGIDGLIMYGLAPEEAGALKAACDGAGIDLTIPVAPGSTDDRLKRVAEMASGFIYCISIAGVTGAPTTVGAEAADLVARVRRFTDLPMAVGPRVSTPEQVAGLVRFADGAVVGSALMDLIGSLGEEEIIGGVAEHVRALKEATIKPGEI